MKTTTTKTTTKTPRPKGRRPACRSRVVFVVTEVETLPPEQEAALDWLVRRVQATMARLHQEAQEKETVHDD